MSGLLQLARPINAAMAFVGVVAAGFVAVGFPAFMAVLVPLVVAGFAAVAFTAGGNALNDIYDRTTDVINHPERPIPSGRVTVQRAGVFAASAFGVAFVLGALLNIWCFLIVASNALLMYAYESDLKARGFSGNVAISYLVASLFLFGGFAVAPNIPVALERVAVLAALAFFATLGREITKDIEDIAGDVDRRTLPQRIGVRSAGLVAGAALFTGVALSVVPWYLRLLSIGYVVIVVLADGMFIYAALQCAAHPGRSQRITKYAMVVALVAFLAGGFP